MPKRVLLMLAFLVLPSTFACTPAALQATAAGLNAASAAGSGSGPLLLFGGEGHKTFLGCLTCSKYDRNSVLNSYGSFGSPYGATSILNPYGNFGSAYSTYSPCNPYASDPPVIVDGTGKYYGRLTVNQYRSDAAKTTALIAWLTSICKH